MWGRLTLSPNCLRIYAGMNWMWTRICTPGPEDLCLVLRPLRFEAVNQWWWIRLHSAFAQILRACKNDFMRTKRWSRRPVRNNQTPNQIKMSLDHDSSFPFLQRGRQEPHGKGLAKGRKWRGNMVAKVGDALYVLGVQCHGNIGGKQLGAEVQVVPAGRVSKTVLPSYGTGWHWQSKPKLAKGLNGGFEFRLFWNDYWQQMLKKSPLKIFKVQIQDWILFGDWPQWSPWTASIKFSCLLRIGSCVLVILVEHFSHLRRPGIWAALGPDIGRSELTPPIDCLYNFVNVCNFEELYAMMMKDDHTTLQ